MLKTTACLVLLTLALLATKSRAGPIKASSSSSSPTVDDSGLYSNGPDAIVTTANGNKHVFLGVKRAFASPKSGSTYVVMEDRYWKVDNNEVKDYRLSRYRQRLDDILKNDDTLETIKLCKENKKENFDVDEVFYFSDY